MHLFSLALALVNPLFAAISSIIILLKERRIIRFYLYVIVLLFALFNITIDQRQTDYSWYLPLFKDGYKEPLYDYLFSLDRAKEPIYTFINWVLSHIFNGSVICYSIFSTCFFYICCIEGFIKWQNKCGIDDKFYVTVGCLFFMLFPYIFANSANLLRQYYATGLLLLILPEILSGNKKYWILALICVFIHTSSGLFVLLLLMPFLNWRLTPKTALFYIVGFVIIKYLSIIADYLMQIPQLSFLSYALLKASTETTFETEYTFSKMLFSIVIVFSFYIISNINNEAKNNNSIIKFANIQLFSLSYMLININQAELCERLDVYIWCFLPYDFMIICYYCKVNYKYLQLYIIYLSAFFIFYHLYLSGYMYYSRHSIFTNTLFEYFQQSKFKL